VEYDKLDQLVKIVNTDNLVFDEAQTKFIKCLYELTISEANEVILNFESPWRHINPLDLLYITENVDNYFYDNNI
jgi:hypothetical protein